MSKPQQPELARSRKGATDVESAKAKIDDQPDVGRPHGVDKGDKGGGEGGGVPPGNRSPYPS